MKHTLTLAAWNFRLARRSRWRCWGIFAAQQLALVVFVSAGKAAGMGLASNYYDTMQIFAYLGFYLLTGLAAGLATHSKLRLQRVQFWHPGAKFGAKAIIAAAEVVFAAWQFVWYIVEFYPVTALEVHLARKLYGAALPPANPVMSRSSPTTCSLPAAAPPLAGDLAGHPGPVRPAAGRAGHRARLASCLCSPSVCCAPGSASTW